jgi:hypothetical protein
MADTCATRPKRHDSPTPRSTLMRALAWIGTGATIAAAAFGIHPVHASAVVFWTVLVIGLLLIAAGVVPLRHTLSSRRTQGPARRRQAAAECRRLLAALEAFIRERERERPRVGLFNGNPERMNSWREQTVALYRIDLRPWSMRVFAEAVALDAASDTAMPLVEAPSANQMIALGSLFRDAAEQLERTPA